MKEISDERIVEIASEVLGIDVSKAPMNAVRKLIKSIRTAISLIPRVEGVRKEIDNVLRGMDGEYIEPGPSGSILRGKIEVLPTGRNFYAVDPLRIPTPAAWRVGVKLAEKLIEEYRGKYGKYPETIGIVEWCIDPFRADGEGVAQVLHILGVKPVWDPESGCVLDIEPIPLRELKRPRIDVLVRVDGIFRDTTPNLMTLIDRAIKKVASLNEAPEVNYVRKHVLERLKHLERSGIDENEAFRLATYRVFSEKPGAYGAGANLVVYASAWKSKKDIGEAWIDWASYAYGENTHAVHVPEELKNVLRNVDLTYQKLESDDFDILDCCCFFGYHGGMHAAAESLSNKKLAAYFGDSRDPDRPSIRTMDEELERVVISRLLNPQWIEGKRRHGFKGASEISERVGRVYGWGATAGIVKDWVFNEITRAFVLDEEMRRWFIDTNPWALEEIARRLIEAAERGVWEAPKELLEGLKEVYSEIEGFFEEAVSSEGEYQGGRVVVVTRDDLKKEGYIKG